MWLREGGSSFGVSEKRSENLYFSHSVSMADSDLTVTVKPGKLTCLDTLQ